MPDATETTKPIMQYVRGLEDKVRRYQAGERRSVTSWFFAGFLAGAGLMGLLRLIL